MEDVLREQINTLRQLLEQKDQQIKYLENLLPFVVEYKDLVVEKPPITPYFSGDF